MTTFRGPDPLTLLFGSGRLRRVMRPIATGVCLVAVSAGTAVATSKQDCLNDERFTGTVKECVEHASQPPARCHSIVLASCRRFGVEVLTAIETFRPTTPTNLPLVSDFMASYSVDAQRVVNTCHTTFGLPQSISLIQDIQAQVYDQQVRCVIGGPCIGGTAHFVGSSWPLPMEGAASYPIWSVITDSCGVWNTRVCGSVQVAMLGLPQVEDPNIVDGHPAVVILKFSAGDRRGCVMIYNGNASAG
jgi:hypothetical protein